MKPILTTEQAQEIAEGVTNAALQRGATTWNESYERVLAFLQLYVSKPNHALRVYLTLEIKALETDLARKEAYLEGPDADLLSDLVSADLTKLRTQLSDARLRLAAL